jgi:hypothetical protein
VAVGEVGALVVDVEAVAADWAAATARVVAVEVVTAVVGWAEVVTVAVVEVGSVEERRDSDQPQ